MTRRCQSRLQSSRPILFTRRRRARLDTLISVLLGLIISGIPMPALAAEQAHGDLCAEAMTQVAMRECLNTRYQQADIALNQMYKQLMAQLGPTQQTKFKQAQRAWIAFRDASAVFAASTAEGGSLAPVLSLVELVSMTEARTVTMQEIRRTLDDR